jgi:hypothetical protein
MDGLVNMAQNAKAPVVDGPTTPDELGFTID